MYNKPKMIIITVSLQDIGQFIKEHLGRQYVSFKITKQERIQEKKLENE